MQKEYRISSLADFLQVPADKLDECLADFQTWLSLARQADEVSRIGSNMLGAEAKLSLRAFTWIDDGKRGVSAMDVVTTDGQRIGRIKEPQ